MSGPRAHRDFPVQRARAVQAEDPESRVKAALRVALEQRVRREALAQQVVLVPLALLARLVATAKVALLVQRGQRARLARPETRERLARRVPLEARESRDSLAALVQVVEMERVVWGECLGQLVRTESWVKAEQQGCRACLAHLARPEHLAHLEAVAVRVALERAEPREQQGHSDPAVQVVVPVKAGRRVLPEALVALENLERQVV